MIPPLEDGELQEDALLGASLISEELAHRAFLRQQGLFEERERQQQQIIDDGIMARRHLDNMDFEETDSKLELWDRTPRRKIFYDGARAQKESDWQLSESKTCQYMPWNPR